MFICSVLTCAIGVLTFIAGMIGRAKNDGVIVQKLNQAIASIEELKTDVKGLTSNQQTLALLVNSHAEQIKTLFKLCNSAEGTAQCLLTIMKSLKTIESEVTHNAQYSD